MANIVARRAARGSASRSRARDTIPFDAAELERLRAQTANADEPAQQAHEDLEVEIEIENLPATKRARATTISDPMSMSVLVELERRENAAD